MCCLQCSLCVLFTVYNVHCVLVGIGLDVLLENFCVLFTEDIVCCLTMSVLSNRLVRFLLENTLLSPCFHALSVLTRKALGVVLDDNLYSYLLLLLHYICCESSGLYIRRWYSL